MRLRNVKNKKEIMDSSTTLVRNYKVSIIIKKKNIMSYYSENDNLSFLSLDKNIYSRNDIHERLDPNFYNIVYEEESIDNQRLYMNNMNETLIFTMKIILIIKITQNFVFYLKLKS